MRRAVLASAVMASALAVVAVGLLVGTVLGAIEHPRARALASRLIGVNDAEVEPGLIRGGRLTGWRLAAYQRLHGFRTVVHLAWDGHEVDRAERDFFEGEGVDFHSFDWDPTRAAETDQLDAALALLRDAPRPIYVHCIGGKDRTGGLLGLWDTAHGASMVEVREDWDRHGWPAVSWREAVARTATR